LRFANQIFPRRLDRDEAMQSCYNQFGELLTEYRKPAGVRRMPIIAITASPGSGKSYFVDEVGDVRAEDVDQFCTFPHAIPSAFKSALTIKISLNGFSNLADGFDRGRRGVCIRMLYRFSVGCSTFHLQVGKLFYLCACVFVFSQLFSLHSSRSCPWHCHEICCFLRSLCQV
jgi:hypothetical protein